MAQVKFFGLTFLLYWTNLSVGYGFWKSLRNTDIDLYNETVVVERLSKRLKKCETNLSFLIKCRDGDVYPKFVRWKNTRYLESKQKKKIFRRNLLNEITLKHKTISFIVPSGGRDYFLCL